MNKVYAIIHTVFTESNMSDFPIYAYFNKEEAMAEAMELNKKCENPQIRYSFKELEVK